MNLVDSCMLVGVRKGFLFDLTCNVSGLDVHVDGWSNHT
jgi:hypothetical protein